MSEGEAAPAAAPVDAGLAAGDTGPVTLPNPPSITEALAVNEPAIAEPGEHEKTKKPEGDEPEAKADGEEKPEVKDEPETDDEPKKRPSGAQRNKQRAALAEANLEAARHRIFELEQKLAPKAIEGLPQPKESDFPNDYVAFDRAWQAWNAEQAAERAFARREAKMAEEGAKTATARQQAAHEEYIESRKEAYAENAALMRERVKDFDKVVNAAKISITELVQQELLDSEKPAAIQHYLADKPDKVRELNQMTPRELAKEIGRLEARIHLPKPKTATEASAPLSNPTGGAAPAFNPRTASMDEYVAARKSGWTGK